MKLVKQTAYGQCGAACLAMVMGDPLDRIVTEVTDRIGPTNMAKGMMTTDVVDHLHIHGFVGSRVTRWWDGSEPAILVVPSLNHNAILHAIVWDGVKFLDPSEGPLLYPADADPRARQRAAIIFGGREERS